jgi:hypothetical protein
VAITGDGWEMSVERLGQHQGPHLIRTYGRYAVYIDGRAVSGLEGFICESQGPGENYRRCDESYRRRVVEGTYKLFTHDTHYASVGYSSTATYPTKRDPMPAFGLEDRGRRDGILVHAAHDHGLFLASIGCLNPTRALEGGEDMDIDDSRQRVIALLDSLSDYYPQGFRSAGRRQIGDATIVIQGEPLNWL